MSNKKARIGDVLKSKDSVWFDRIIKVTPTDGGLKYTFLRLPGSCYKVDISSNLNIEWDNLDISYNGYYKDGTPDKDLDEILKLLREYSPTSEEPEKKAEAIIEKVVKEVLRAPIIKRCSKCYIGNMRALFGHRLYCDNCDNKE